MIYGCELSSCNFALTHAEDRDDPELMAKLFPGMSVETARVVLRKYRSGTLIRVSKNAIEVPDSEVVG